ncbi:MAG: Rieske 2Fe-2S domain-containing protein, partial [Proteobacteria bacterium]|nr:Rieske 2Fe-2S domain-containing protein [Pseudomonadota bacterium]
MSEARQSSGPVPFTKITAERYISPEYMRLEREKVWAKTWLVAGVAQDVEQPGDFFVFDLEPESIIVSRAEDGSLNAFYNVCQHRGAR